MRCFCNVKIFRNIYARQEGLPGYIFVIKCNYIYTCSQVFLDRYRQIKVSKQKSINYLSIHYVRLFGLSTISNLGSLAKSDEMQADLEVCS